MLNSINDVLEECTEDMAQHLQDVENMPKGASVSQTHLESIRF